MEGVARWGRIRITRCAHLQNPWVVARSHRLAGFDVHSMVGNFLCNVSGHRGRCEPWGA